MKPFDLERALAGDPVVTRDGRPVTQITHFDGVSERENVFGVVDEHFPDRWVRFDMDGDIEESLPTYDW